jgi:raffinose/stachyose/melibiose transport system substrate-binding protein
MKFEKRLILILLVFLMTAVLGFAGGKRDSSGRDGKTVVNFLHIFPEWEALMQKSVDMYVAKHPNVEFKIDIVPWDQCQKILQTRIAAGEAPDVSYYWGNRIQHLTNIGEALDLTPYLDADPAWKSSFLSQAVLNIGVRQGKVYDIPFRGSAVFIYYNKDLFDRNGYKEPQTREELEAIMADLVNKGVTPFAIMGKGDGMLPAAQFNDMRDALSLEEAVKTGLISKPEWINKRDDSQAYINSEITAIRKIQEWWNKGYFGRNATAMGREDAQATFAAGRGAMLLANNNELKMLKEQANFTIGAFPIPFSASAQPTQLLCWVDGFFVPAKGKNHDIAVDFLKHLTSPEVQNLWAKEANSICLTKGVSYSDPLQSKFAQTFENIAPVIPMANDWIEGDSHTVFQQQMIELLVRNTNNASTVVDNYIKTRAIEVKNTLNK